MKVLRWALAVACVFLACEASASPGASVRAEVNKAFITIGDTIVYTVLIRHGPADRVLTPIEFPNPRDFEVKSRREIAAKREGDTVISGARFEITAFGLGEFVIDELPIRFLLGDKETQLSTNRIYITVESVDKSGKPKMDIRGLKPTLELPKNTRVWIISGAVAVALVLLGLAVFKMRRRSLMPGANEAVPLSPHDEAYQALHTLFESGLLREGKVREYYFRLSEIIRNYLQRRYEIPAIEKTTDEIAKELSGVAEDPSRKRFITDFLADLDFVKFAKYLPEPAEIVLINRRAGEVVDTTKKADVPAQGNP